MEWKSQLRAGPAMEGVANWVERVSNGRRGQLKGAWPSAYMVNGRGLRGKGAWLARERGVVLFRPRPGAAWSELHLSVRGH